MTSRSSILNPRLFVVLFATVALVFTPIRFAGGQPDRASESSPPATCCQAEHEAAVVSLDACWESWDGGCTHNCPDESSCDCGCCANAVTCPPVLAVMNGPEIRFDLTCLRFSPADQHPPTAWLGVHLQPPIL